MLLNGGAVRISTDDIAFPPQLDYGKNEHFLKVFVLTYVRFLSDSPLRSSNGEKPVRVFTKFLRKLTQEHLRETIKDFSGKADRILSSEYVTGSDMSIHVYDETMKETPVYKEYLTWFRTRDTHILKYLISFLRFGKKLDYDDPEMNSTAFRGWEGVEERLRTVVFDDDDVSSLRNIVAELVGPLDTTYLVPKFGTGKVAEPDISDVYDKLAKLGLNRKLQYAFKRSSSFRLNEGAGLVRDLELRPDSDLSISRLKFVPKDITKSRSICMEPNAFMYFQQEVMRWMVAAMEKGRINKFVKLKDQTFNQRGAMHGSKYLSVDTIDLSSASDSVHWSLVKRIFPRDWTFFMLATRTPKVRVTDNSVVQVEKFAPMGSAVCFPTQCIIFTAVCLYAHSKLMGGKTTDSVVTRRDARAIIREANVSMTPLSPFGKRLEGPIVYGDDIICDSRVTDTVITLLSRLGFEVNVSKSFTKSQSFRESCGVYCYEGSDVTPVLFRIPFLRRGRWDAKIYASIIGSINQWRSNGYHTIATFWLSILRGYRFKYPLPFKTEDDAFGLFTRNRHKPKAPVPSSQMLPHGGDWQVEMEQVQGIGPRVPRRNAPAQHEQYRLDQWWRSRVDGGSTPPIGRGLTIRPQETRLAPVWARCE